MARARPASRGSRVFSYACCQACSPKRGPGPDKTGHCTRRKLLGQATLKRRAFGVLGRLWSLPARSGSASGLRLGLGQLSGAGSDVAQWSGNPRLSNNLYRAGVPFARPSFSAQVSVSNLHVLGHFSAVPRHAASNDLRGWWGDSEIGSGHKLS